MKYFTFLSTFLICLTLQAQAPRGFSLSSGLNYTTFESDDLLADPGMGFKVGTVFNTGYHETYNYQIEVYYNKSTLELLTVDQNLEYAGTSKHNFSTVDLGFYFNYYVIKPEEDKFYLGPQAGITFSFAGKLKPQNILSTEEEYYLPHRLTTNNLDSFPKVNYGAGLGLTGGYNDFRFDLRYALGLNNVLKDVQTNSYNENNIYTGPSLEGKMNVISFTVSYRLNKLFGYE